jgi:uncharacterized membrane protein YsdA (DUF1294 family)
LSLPEQLAVPAAACLSAANLAAFLLMGWDKARSKRRGARRVPERVLFSAAALGGCPGAILGMLAFRHKTRHLRFALGLPAILAAQAALVLWIRSI